MSKTPDPVDHAMRVAAEHFEVSLADIRSQRRSSDVHRARTWGMYLARQTTGASFEEIAARFNRDHMMVRAVVRNRSRDVDDDSASARLFNVLKRS